MSFAFSKTEFWGGARIKIKGETQVRQELVKR